MHALATSISWKMAIFAMEWKKLFSYRMTFWVTFLGSTLTQLLIAYFLWDAIFSSLGVDQIKGHTFKHMILYYLLVPIMFKTISGHEINILANDIYEGSLNKFLLYPLSYFKFRLIGQYANSFFYFIQLVLALSLFSLFFRLPLSVNISLESLAMTFVTVVLASYTYFVIAASLEMLAFFVDNVWSLMIMLRYVVFLLGGALIPLDFYPMWAQEVLSYLPFSGFLYLPINTLSGNVELLVWLKQMGILACWAIFFSYVSKRIWKKGTKQYTGVGI